MTTDRLARALYRAYLEGRYLDPDRPEDQWEVQEEEIRSYWTARARMLLGRSD